MFNDVGFKTNKEKIGIGLFILGWVFLSVTTFIGLTKIGLWNDEFYSIELIKLPVINMIDMGMGDIHPLLYYFIFKFFSKILFFLDFAVIGRITSLIPFYLIGILSYFKIKKEFNWLTAGLFFLCITTMPQMMLFSVEIRMYSWALFFITASFIYMGDIVNKGDLKSWIIFTVLTICSIYTHYFSAIASIGLYFILLIHILINGNKNLKNWFISAVICILSYIPWIFTVINQYQKYNGIFWIEPLHFRTLVSYVYFTLSPAELLIRSNELISPTILGTLLLFSFIYLIYKKREKYAYYGIMAFLFVPIVGILMSILVTPCFHQRYMIPVFGILWLSFSILLSRIYDDNKYIFGIILCLVLLVGCVGTVDFNNIETQYMENTQNEINALQDIIGTGNIVFYNRFPTIYEDYIPNYYFNIYGGNISQFINDTLQNPDIQNKINNGSKVFYIGDQGDIIIKEGVKMNPYYQNQIGMIQFNIYEIS